MSTTTEASINIGGIGGAAEFSAGAGEPVMRCNGEDGRFHGGFPGANISSEGSDGIEGAPDFMEEASVFRRVPRAGRGSRALASPVTGR